MARALEFCAAARLGAHDRSPPWPKGVIGTIVQEGHRCAVGRRHFLDKARRAARQEDVCR